MNRVLRIANLVRNDNDITSVPSPRQIETAAERLGLVVRDAPLVDGLMGVLVRRAEGYVALLRERLDPYLRGLVLAHELGHYALGHEGSHLFTPFSWTAMAQSANRYEKEAFGFAGVFVCGPPYGPHFDERLGEAVTEGYPSEVLMYSLAALSHTADVRGRILA